MCKEGTTKHRTIPLTHDAPAEDHYDMTTLEKKVHGTLTEYNRSRGVDIDSIKEIREKRGPYREPKSTYMKILNDHDEADRKANPKTSTPIRKRVLIEGHGDDDDGDDDDSDDNDDKSSKGKNDKSDDKDKKTPDDRPKFDMDLNKMVNPFFSPKKRPTSNKGLNSSCGESVGDRLLRMSGTTAEQTKPEDGENDPESRQDHRISDDGDSDDHYCGG